ncbi:MAG: EAL domain-containing protein, partial [Pseudomonadota bacterium]
LFPNDFLDVAGEAGVLRRIDQAVLMRVIEDRRLWEAAGLVAPRVSVNISGHRLREPDLITDIRAADFPPGALTIELLESIFLDEADATVDWTIDQLREMGVGIELDDFGTGHSSIVGLIKLKPDGLKIDRQFVMPITESVEKAALVRSIIEIGRSIGVQVVAEGVETLAHARILADLNCDILQGYAFAKPMPPDVLVPFLTEKPWRETG